MTKNFILLFLCCFGINALGQELSCADFRNGSFISTSEFFDMKIHSRIIREGNSQTEILLDSLPGLPPDFPREQHILLEWIDECSYYAWHDNSGTEPSQKYVEGQGKILVEMIKIENGCFYYRSTSKLDGELVTIDGKLCREEQTD